MTQPPDTLSVASINLILFAARQRGANADALARSVGIDPKQLSNPDGRVLIRQVQSLWHEAAIATADPNLSLRLGEMVNPLAIGVLAYVMMHCPTLEQVFDKLCQYQDIACQGVRTSGRLLPAAESDRAAYILSLQITSLDIIYPEPTYNSELSIYLSVIHALTGTRLIPQEVHLAYPRPADTHEHERVFGTSQLTFDADETALIIDAALLATPVLNANSGLFPLFEKQANDVLSQLQTPSLRSRVKTEIIGMMKGEEPTLAAIADRLAMGVRTLQLHLKEAGTTYQQLLDETRKELAIGHLREPNLSTTDIAYLLGFAEPSVFFRSFKKWTGQTPGAYRLAYA